MNYYNEFDPYAAAWLRNLISAGHLPAGEVDERSIVDVQPGDLAGFTQCHFFAGIGGWSLAARLAGWPEDRELWTGSTPCQPFSVAGKQAGQADDRHLWPHLFRLASARRPAVLMGEQVAAAVGKNWLDGVAADLEGIGYDCGAVVVPACALNAPHRRDRLWFVAHAHDPLCETNGLPGGIHAEHHSTRIASGDGKSHWGRAGYTACADGKARRIEPGICRVADGPAPSLARLRSIETTALAEIESYGQPNKIDTDEVLRMVQECVRQETRREAFDSGVLQQLHAPSLLFDFLQCLVSARNGSAKRSGFEKASNETRHRLMRGVRVYEPLGHASRQRRPDEQRNKQLADTLLTLSLVLARLAEAYRESARQADAGSNRVGKLRAFGNAIVPQVAAEVIRAYLETTP